jgi:hypothetical protein
METKKKLLILGRNCSTDALALLKVAEESPLVQLLAAAGKCPEARK